MQLNPKELIAEEELYGTFCIQNQRAYIFKIKNKLLIGPDMVSSKHVVSIDDDGMRPKGNGKINRQLFQKPSAHPGLEYFPPIRRK